MGGLGFLPLLTRSASLPRLELVATEGPPLRLGTVGDDSVRAGTGRIGVLTVADGPFVGELRELTECWADRRRSAPRRRRRGGLR
jgi:hypothetical protein